MPSRHLQQGRNPALTQDQEPYSARRLAPGKSALSLSDKLSDNRARRRWPGVRARAASGKRRDQASAGSRRGSWHRVPPENDWTPREAAFAAVPDIFGVDISLPFLLLWAGCR